MFLWIKSVNQCRCESGLLHSLANAAVMAADIMQVYHLSMVKKFARP